MRSWTHDLVIASPVPNHVATSCHAHMLSASVATNIALLLRATYQPVYMLKKKFIDIF